MSPISESRKRANENYLQKLEEIKVRVPKGKKAIIESHAKAHGESVNGFIGRAVDETIERDTQRIEELLDCLDEKDFKNLPDESQEAK